MLDSDFGLDLVNPKVFLAIDQLTADGAPILSIPLEK